MAIEEPIKHKNETVEDKQLLFRSGLQEPGIEDSHIYDEPQRSAFNLNRSWSSPDLSALSQLPHHTSNLPLQPPPPPPPPSLPAIPVEYYPSRLVSKPTSEHHYQNYMLNARRKPPRWSTPSSPFPSPSSISKERVSSNHRRSQSRSHRRKLSSRNNNSLDLSVNATTLLAPTFVPCIHTEGPNHGPQVNEKPPGGVYWALLNTVIGDDGDDLSAHGPDQHDRPFLMPIQLCEPPLHDIMPAYPQALDADPQPRVRKQSKYTAEQDRLILELKTKGNSWAEIAKLAGCHNQLAARNRYQVLIGQQGGGTFFWAAEDCAALQACLDEGERAKWVWLAQELSKSVGSYFSLEMVHYKISAMFAENSEQFGVIKTRDPSQGGAPFKRSLLSAHSP